MGELKEDNQHMRDISEPKQAIKMWLEQCKADDIKPWEYDLKNEIYRLDNTIDVQPCNQGDKRYVAIENLLKSWIGDFGTTINKKETEDCALMQCIYEILWGTQSKHSEGEPNPDVDADVMYSFWIPYKKSMACQGIYNWTNNPYIKSKPETLKPLLSYLEVGKYKKLSDTFEGFARKTHTIGNMALAHVGFNAGGGIVSHNDNATWQVALDDMKQKYTANEWSCLGVTNYDEYNKNFFFDIDEEHRVSAAYVVGMSIDELLEIITGITSEIENRGHAMTKYLIDKVYDQESDIKPDFFVQ